MVLLWTTISQYVSLLIMKRVINYTLTSYLKEVIWPLTKTIALSALIPLAIRLNMEEGWPRFLLIGTASVLMTALCSYLFALQTTEKEMAKEYCKKITQKWTLKR